MSTKRNAGWDHGASPGRLSTISSGRDFSAVVRRSVASGRSLCTLVCPLCRHVWSDPYADAGRAQPTMTTLVPGCGTGALRWRYTSKPLPGNRVQCCAWPTLLDDHAKQGRRRWSQC